MSDTPIPENVDEQAIDVVLRPKLWEDYIGQEQVKKNLRVIIDAAKMRGEAVDHLLLYGQAGLGKTTLARLIAKELGNIKYIYSIRVAPGPVRNNDEVNALWDLAPHDISIFLYLLGKEPTEIKAFSSNFLRKDIIDSASFILKFNEIIAETHVRWWDAEKIRKFTVIGDKKIAVFDEASTEKLKIYSKRVEINNGKTKIIDEGMFAPNLDTTSPLEIQCRHFLNCIKNNKKPLTDGKNGYNVVKILEDIENKF